MSRAMLALYDATIDCQPDVREAYKWARHEYEKNPDGTDRVVDGKKIPTNPINFPLEHCSIFHSGSRIVISIASRARRGETAGPDFRLDVLEEAEEPKKTTKGQKDTWTATGMSERKHALGITDEHSVVTFTVINAEGVHESGGRLAV